MIPAIKRDMILSYLTLPHLLPPDFLSVAHDSGYQGVSVRLIPANPPVEPQLPMFAGSPLLAETVARLDATGLYVNDIEVLKIEPQVDLARLEPVLESAALLCARNLLVVAADEDESRVSDNLATIAQLSARYGLRTCIECMIYMGIRTMAQAARLLARTGDDSIGVVIDPLHLDRAGERPEDIGRLDASQIASVQLCDAGDRPDRADLAAIMAEARENRMAPGTGTLPLADVVKAVPGDIPVSLEVPTRGLIGTMPDRDVAAIMRDAAIRVLTNQA